MWFLVWYNKRVKYIWKSLLILLGGVIGGYLLLVLVFCLPVGRVHNNVLKSAESFDGEYTMLINDNLAARTDDWTDALMLLTAENSYDRNPFTGSIYAYHLSRTDAVPHVLIKNLENPENASSQYSRYWHGYLLFLKPLLMFFTYGQIQVLISFIVLALIVAVVYVLQKKKMSEFIVPYGITIAVLYPLTISISMQFFTVFAIFNLAILYILCRHEKMMQNNSYFYVFLVIGILTCYFDFLTYPLVTLGIPLVVWLIVANRKKMMKMGKNILQIIIASVGWAVGYFGIWVGKWAWGSLITGENLFRSAMDAAENRASASAFSGEISRFSPIAHAFKVIFSEPVCVILVLAIIVVVILLIMKKIKISRTKALNNLWLFVVAMMPLAWYIVFANHSESHIFFTYRTMGVLVFAVSCYLVTIIERPKVAEKGKKKNG